MKRILLAGFGGQGILFAGKFIAYIAVAQGKNVTWLPSYGPEMRGGTANCSVIISEEAIGSPIVSTPDVLVCMNIPSLDKFADDVADDGAIFIDSSLIDREPSPGNRTVYKIPATKLALENGMKGLANMIMVGALIKDTGICEKSAVLDAMRKTVSERKKDLFDLNLKAVDVGFNYSVEEGNICRT
jgi:2-oxoglutarate ferredoxin oxidoreductase subunit gamma